MFAYLKQSTASQTRTVGPFIDDTDFKTTETGLTIANTDVKLSKNGGASANKNSGGGTHIANGMYALTFDATDSNTVGELTVSIDVAGALIVVAKFWVLEEAIYDALFGASAAGFDASQRVDVGKVAGTAQTAGDLAARLPAALVSGRIDASIDGVGMEAAAIDAILTRQMTESYAADGAAPTLAQALHLLIAVLTEFEVSGTTMTAKELDGATTAATFTLDDAAGPTSITRST